MTTTFIRILVSIGAAYVLFTHLNTEALPSKPTLQDWVGPHGLPAVTEALVSDPTVDAAVREQARRFYSLASIEVIIGADPFGFDREPLPPSHFSGKNLSIDIAVPDQPEAMWMLDRTVGKNGNQLDFYDCYHNGMVEDIPVDGRVILTFDVVDRHARILQRKIDGEYLDDIADCVEGHLDGLEVADGIHELVTLSTHEEN